jgi:hypothetical protein
MYSKIYLVFIALTLSVSAFAQQTKTPPEIREQKRQVRRQHIAVLAKRAEEGSLIYNKQSVFGFKLNTDGWTALFEHGRYKTTTVTNTWFLEIGERKSHKEEKVTATDATGFPIGNPLIYGKQNVFYNVNIGIGQQRLIGGKGPKNGVAVSAIYGGGFSAGLLKPYYVTIIDPNTSQTRDIKYEGAKNDTLFLGYAFSSAGFTKGFREMKFTPGLIAHAGLRFDYGRYNELLSAIEVGVSAEYYTKEMPILVNVTPKKFFYNAYVAIEFGKRN